MNLLDDFERWLKEEGRRPTTIEEYIRSVRLLQQWMEERTGQPFRPADVTALDLHDWKEYMTTIKRYAPKTINKRIASIKVFWTYLMDTNQVTVDPTKKLKLKRVSSLMEVPRWLTRREQAQVIHQAMKERNPWKRKRNVAMFQCMLQGSLRISEVVNLDLMDVDFDRNILTIRQGKGGKFRFIPMNKDLIKALKEWLEVRQEVDHDALFLSHNGNRMVRQLIYRQLRKVFDSLQLVDAKPHSLRHSFCKNLIDAGQPLQVVAQLAGHESLETTRVYVTPSHEELIKAIESISEER